MYFVQVPTSLPTSEPTGYVEPLNAAFSNSELRLTKIAGTGVQGFSADNLNALTSSLNNPKGVVTDGLGIIYFADTGNHRIRTIIDGYISTLAGISSL